MSNDSRATVMQVRPPMPPTYFFAIDVSAEAVSSGVLQVTASLQSLTWMAACGPSTAL
jgi:Sec23/Sec24 trunk domain